MRILHLVSNLNLESFQISCEVDENGSDSHANSDVDSSTATRACGSACEPVNVAELDCIADEK